MGSRRGRRDEDETPVVTVLVEGDEEPVEPPDAGCGCQAAAAFVVVPLVLEIVALLLIWFGPGAGDRWFPKGLLVAVGGLLLTGGCYLALIALAARHSPLLAGPFATVAAVRADDGPRLALLRGRAEADPTAGELPRAPFSGRPCLAVTLAVHRIDDFGAELGPNARRLHEETRSTPFRLRDRTGSIPVDPTGAAIAGVPGGERAVDAADDEAVRAFAGELREVGITIALTRRERTVGFAAKEDVLLPGTGVLVVGSVVERDGERWIAAGDPGDLFSIATAGEADLLAGLRTTARRLRIAAVVVPLAGAAMVIGGFWWVLTG